MDDSTCFVCSLGAGNDSGSDFERFYPYFAGIGSDHGFDSCYSRKANRLTLHFGFISALINTSLMLVQKVDFRLFNASCNSQLACIQRHTPLYGTESRDLVC